MKLIAHRGYWEKVTQQNSYTAIMLGLLLCEGVEIDLRLFEGKIVISHDHLRNSNSLLLKDALALHYFFPEKIWALNIKEDGLSSHIANSLKEFSNLKYFCFDMSFPETMLYLKKKIRVASRISDFECENKFVSKNSNFYVLDGFKKLNKHKMSYKKKAMVISPELHKRQFKLEDMKRAFGKHFYSYYFCTDNVAELC